ncbi:MAG: PfkB family carbohydrate kinase [Mesorhizobium sp.]
MTPRLLHVGSAVVDYVYRLDSLPPPGAEKTATSYRRVVGGGFNMMVAAARSGMAVAFGGQHGTGPDGDLLRGALAAEGIEVLSPRASGLDTGNSVVLITDDAERTFVSWPGAESRVTPDMLASIEARPGDWVFVSGYTLSYPGSRDALAGWIEALPPPVPFVFDPAPVVGDIPAAILSRVLARVTWLSCNRAEAAAIAGPGGIQEAAAALLSSHCPRAAGVVVRAGEQGCLVRLAGGASRAVAGFPVEAVDTNGAGDAHIGAFVAALSRGEDPFEVARYANAAAAISVTRPGGSSAPSDAEIRNFLKSAPGETGARKREDRVHA